MGVLEALASCAGITGIIVSAVVGVLIWRFQRKLEKRDAKKEAAEQERLAVEKKREEAREQLDVFCCVDLLYNRENKGYLETLDGDYPKLERWRKRLEKRESE